MIDQSADPREHDGDPAAAFDVIAASFPGFGFFTPLPGHPDLNFWKVADFWHTLMTGILGHTRYTAASCDVGALVTGQLGHKYADEFYAIHVGSSHRHVDPHLREQQPLPLGAVGTTGSRQLRRRPGSRVGHEISPGVRTSQRVQNFLDSDRASWYNHVNLTAHNHGGQFTPWEIPDEWVTELRRTFRRSR